MKVSSRQTDIFCFCLCLQVRLVFVYMLLFTAACVLGCQNGGTLNGDTCSCDCVGGFSGRSCSG